MPRKTKAAIAFGLDEPLKICELDLADPRPDQVMIRIDAAGLCHSDLSVLNGVIGHDFPVVLGHEGVGIIEAVGENVADFQIGDRVIPYLVPDCGKCVYCESGRTNMCVEYTARYNSPDSPFSLDGAPVRQFVGLGTFSEYTVVAADSIVKIGDEAPSEHACCIGCGVTTGLGSALDQAQITPGSSVAVIGLGGVGLSVIQGAKMAGASRIIAIDTNSTKQDVAKACGATDFINPEEVPDLVKHVIGLTELGVDYAFECVGRPEIVEQALAMANPCWGVAMWVGISPEKEPIQILPSAIRRGRVLKGSMMGGAKRQDVARFVDMSVQGKYDMSLLVSDILPLEDINSGFDAMKSGEAVRSVVRY